MRTRFSSLLFVSIAACGGPGAVGNAARPEAPTGSEAFEEKPAAGCEGVGKYAEPLIVDWKSQERTDLELAMKKGVAVVSYDCKTIRMLKDCSLNGSYEYAGVSLKEDMVQLENADEVRANLPLSGIKLGGELERGSSIDVALVMVGKRGSTAGAVSKDTLKGTCEGATHVVRAAYVGAFAMARGSRGKVRAVAEVFGAGGEAKSESQKHTSNKDGDVTACKSSSPDSPKPPDQCQSALRLELTPISNQPVAAEKQEKTSPADLGANTCGPGEVRATRTRRIVATQRTKRNVALSVTRATATAARLSDTCKRKRVHRRPGPPSTSPVTRDTATVAWRQPSLACPRTCRRTTRG